ncbi:MAG: nitrite/sulfite reductase [Alphaproteobacteria bacterium]|nr:nitrite/sulfite reductase [Alphaproteobacteria bacterium]
MYQYDELDSTLVKERAEQFRGQVARRLAGDLTEEEFKPLRLMNGLYLQLHSYMLRVAVPYGAMSSKQMHKLAHIARCYDKGYGHFTTRQNIQFNWPALVDVPAILDELAEVEMHAIQTSGNCIRNVTSDQYAGAAADEVEDPRPYAEMIRQWSTFHPEFSYLPRKFKIALTGSDQDRAAVKVHDIGLRIHKNEKGETGFEVFVGGGLGRTPYIGQVIRRFLPKAHLLSYLEAVLRVYNLIGRRDNKYKARIKILVNAEGIDGFRGKVEEEWAAIKNSAIDLPQEEVKRIDDFFAPPAFETNDAENVSLDAQRSADKGFDRWVRINLAPHKVSGYTIVNVSLKGIGAIPGDISSEQMDRVADIAEQYSFNEIRATHAQNLVLPHVKKSDLFRVYNLLKEVGLETANIGLVSDIIACPGLDYCALANTRSIPIAQRISQRFADRGIQEDVGEVQIKISGCINACGHHHVGHIGILGVDKKGEEFYQITLGGSAANDAAIGEIAGRGFSSDAVVDAVEKLVDFYREKRQDNERFLDTYRRVGAEPFKEILYDAA